ncbi:MAG: hypothetical protein JST16_19175 [Bdellovibrionales bacterium]|nr:hypothetical protein [Bdellovibrionales bacterium]
MKKYFFATLALAGTVAQAGHFVGNGSDKHAFTDDSAWFNRSFGPAPTVKVCIRRDPLFPISAGVAQNIFSDSVRIWKKYVAEHFIERQLPNFSFLTDCNGTEQLTIYLGSTTPQTAAAKRKYINPEAFAELLNLDPSGDKSRGFLWFAPSTADNAWNTERLGALMLHELGHVFGCAHVDGTIMAEDIESFVFAPPAEPSDPTPHLFNRIDWSHELVHAKRGARTWMGDPQGSQETSLSFGLERLLGQAMPTDKLAITLRQEDPAQRPEAIQELTLTYSSGTLQHRFPLRFDGLWISDPYVGVDEFKTLFTNNNAIMMLRRVSYADYYVGSLQDEAGKQHVILLEYNRARPVVTPHVASRSGPIQIYLLDSEPSSINGQRKTLIFSAKVLSDL